MSLLGLTIDYGPYGFQEWFDQDHVPNGSDGTARYSYKQQPSICKWNCMRLAEALDFGGALNKSAGYAIVEEKFDSRYKQAYEQKMRQKLGLTKDDVSGDEEFFASLFSTMSATNADFTETFTSLEAFAGASGDRSSLMETLDSLVNVCAPPTTVAKTFETKMKIQRPGMDPQRLMQLWQVAQTDPQQLSHMFGAPAKAIVEELRGEMEVSNDRASERAKREQMIRSSLRSSWLTIISRCRNWKTSVTSSRVASASSK